VNNQRFGIVMNSVALAKQYDYLYMPDNTEVIQCDISFNNLWQYPASPFNIGLARPAQIQIGQHTTIQNLDAATNADFQILQTLQARIAELTKQKDSPDPTSAAFLGENEYASTQGAQAAEIATLQGQVNDYQNKIMVNQGRAGQLATEQRAATLAQQMEQQGRLRGMYAENLTFNQVNTAAGLSANAQAFAEAGTTVSNKVLTVMDQAAMKNTYGTQDDGRLWFNVVMDQFIQGSNEMMTIELKIKGDPYWLGIPNTAPDYLNHYFTDPLQAGDTIIPGSGSNTVNANGQPSFFSGEQYLLFRYSIPRGWDAGTPTPNIGPGASSVFNGIYFVTTIEHSWENGIFTSTLHCIRDWLTLDVPNINLHQGIGTSNPAPAGTTSSGQSASGTTSNTNIPAPTTTASSTLGANSALQQAANEGDYSAQALGITS